MCAGCLYAALHKAGLSAAAPVQARVQFAGQRTQVAALLADGIGIAALVTAGEDCGPARAALHHGVGQPPHAVGAQPRLKDERVSRLVQRFGPEGKQLCLQLAGAQLDGSKFVQCVLHGSARFGRLCGEKGGIFPVFCDQAADVVIGPAAAEQLQPDAVVKFDTGEDTDGSDLARPRDVGAAAGANVIAGDGDDADRTA